MLEREEPESWTWREAKWPREAEEPDEEPSEPWARRGDDEDDTDA